MPDRADASKEGGREALWPLLAASLWGGMYVVSGLTFQSIPPITLGLARLLIGAAVLVLVLRRLPRLSDHRLAGLGALLAGTLILQFWGTKLAGAAAASLLTLLTPVGVAILAPILLREQTRPRQWAGITIALIGATAVTGGGGFANPLGAILLVGCSITWAAFTVAGASLVRERGALEVTTAATVWAIPIMIPATLVELGAGQHLALTGSAVLGAFYLGVLATALAWWAWNRGVERLSAVAVAVFFLAQPVVGIGLSIPIFHFPLTAGFIVGAILVAAGVLLAS